MKYFEMVPVKKRGLFWSFVRYFRYGLSQMSLIKEKVSFVPKRHYVAICAIFKNEGMFLKEWIEYHLLIGVEHFYLYNNFSDDDYWVVLEPYIRKGLVTLTDWPVEKGQLSAYKDCYDKRKDSVNWIAYIDLDEFICLREANDLRKWLREYERYPSVYMNWKMFGTSGILEHDSKQFVIEQYTACWPVLVNAGKSFVNTAWPFSSIGCHMSYPDLKICHWKTTVLPIDEFKRFICHWVVRDSKRIPSIQLNHYFNRSYHQWVYKVQVRGDALSEKGQQYRADWGNFQKNELMNIDRDYLIQKWLVFLRLQMDEMDLD